MTRTENIGHLETIRKLIRRKNRRLETLAAMGGVHVDVFMSEVLLEQFPRMNNQTRRALQECPWCLVIRNDIGEKALARAEAAGEPEIREMVRRQSE